MGQLAEVRYVRGPQTIKSEDTFLVGYVIFDKVPEVAEVDVVEQCQRFIDEKIATGEFTLPAGVSYRFAGSYENQVRATEKLRVVLPLALFLICLILYLQFRSIASTMIVFSGVFVAWAGGFLLIWLYGQHWFLDFSFLGENMRDLFQVHPINLSVAVWVGFLALFGIATDDGVIMSAYLRQTFERERPKTRDEIREAVVLAGKRRIRPCLMTTATTVLALIPVITSTGRGSDVMVPMAIPSFGGMLVVLITVFVVPTLDCAVREWKARWEVGDAPVE
jgi:Cu(I)/Ag(I) efflux system membrane protein CusA/SilA